MRDLDGAQTAISTENKVPTHNAARRRFLLDDDGSNFFCHTMTEDVATSVAERVAECPDAVTTYLLCSGAATFYYPTKVGDVCTLDLGNRPEGALLPSLHAKGVDPFGMLLRALKEAGKETFVTYRMNDVHNADEPDHPLIPRFKKEHPDCVVDPLAVREGRANWLSYCYDYTREDVREYILATIRELVEWYDFDGLQLDWMRFPRHLSGTPEEVWEKRGILTDFVAEVRQLLDSTTGGRRLLSARVPTSPAGCRFVGLDLSEWTRRGLVDFIVATPFLASDPVMPIAELRGLMVGHPVPIYADIEFEHGVQVHTPESLRATASSLYDCGADGIYLFNFPCWTEYIASPPYHWLAPLASPETASAKPLLFSLTHRQHRLANVDLPGVLPVTALPQERVDLTMRLPQCALPARRALVLVHSGGDIALSVNGEATTELSFLRRAELFPEFVPHALHHQRPKNEESRVFHVPVEVLRPGDNHLRFENISNAKLQLQRVNLGLW